ncbi:hypothetical protein MD484_g2653, partial [Candolleomyces efflorescens]
MDPLSVLGTVLAISQAAQAIKASIDKVKGNKKRLESLVTDIVSSLDDLEKFTKAHLNEVDGSLLLSSAISKLQHDICLLLGRCQKLARQNDGGHLSKVKAAVKAWNKRDEIEGELCRIKESISSCYAQFTAFTAARVENASYRLENSIVVRGVEQEAKLRRLEVLVTNVLLDTGFGKQVVQQIGHSISTHSGGSSIENDYLCLQLRTVLDTMEAHAGYRGPVSETSTLPLSFQPEYSESVPHDFLVTDVLVLSRTLRTSNVFSIAQVARDLQSVAIKLNDLNFTKEACAAQKTSVQLFRNLVGGGTNIFLPYLAHALKNLAVFLRNSGLCREALLASHDSIGAYRIICQTYPEMDFRPMLAISLKTHGEALGNIPGRYLDSLDVLAEANALYSELVEEVITGRRSASFTLLFSGCNNCLAYGDALRNQGKYTEAFDAFKQALRYLSLVSKHGLDNHVLWNTPSRLFSSIFRLLMMIYENEGGPLSYAREVVTLYQQVLAVDAQRFSSHYFRSIYVFAFIHRFGQPKDAEHITMESQHIATLQFIFTEDNGSYFLDNGGCHLGSESFDPVIEYLQRTEAGHQVVDQTPYFYLSFENDPPFFLPALAESTHELVVAFAAAHPSAALDAVQRATTNAIALQNTHQYLLSRILELLRDISDKIDLSNRARVIPHAHIVLEHCRTALSDAEVAKTLVLFGYTMINARRESEGIAAIEEAVSSYRNLLPESPALLSDFISCLKDFGVFLLKSGHHLRGMEILQEAIELCHKTEMNEPSSITVNSLYVTTLLHVCDYLLTTDMHAHAHPLASRVYDLVASSASIATYSQANLHTVLIQCLRLSGRLDQAKEVSLGVASALECNGTRPDATEAQLQAYEHLIHCYALQGNSEALDAILQKAYATFKEKMGGDVSPTALGLRHDTLAIIASHYANFDRPENVLPFAKAAVQTSSQAPIRNVAQDMQYLESVCDVAAFLWNSGKSDDALGLLESVAESQRNGGAEPAGESADRSLRQTVESLPSDSFQEGLRSHLSSVLSGPSASNHKLEQPISAVLAIVSNIVESAGRPSDVKGGSAEWEGGSKSDPSSVDEPSGETDGIHDPEEATGMTAIPDDKLFSHAERVKGKVVVITGGASGIGKESALRFAEHGAKVVIGDLNGPGAQAVVDDIEAAGGTAVSIKCNVVVWEDLVALFELAISKYKAVDIVIPNAGVNERADFDTVRFENGKPVKPKLTTLDVNLNAVIYTVHLAQHYLCVNKKDGDLKSIVLIGSVASWVGIPKGNIYSASKHAILGLMRAMYRTLDVKGIRVSCIHPFFADTNILRAPVRLFLAGIPMLPVPRIAGAIFYSATDPDPTTNASSWLLPDDGPVWLIEKEEFKFGVYKMIDERANAVFGGAKGFIYYKRLFTDIWQNTAPVRNFGIAVALGVYAWKNQEQISSLVGVYVPK